jgi:hypothetical protein
MLIACWSAKGGSGTTVVTASMALMLARRESAGALIADLAGDVAAVLGMSEDDSPGIAGWLRAGPDVSASGLKRLELTAAPQLALLPRGPGPLPADRGSELAAVLERDERHVIADCGTLRDAAADHAASTVAHSATLSLLVIRPDYLSLRHAVAAPIRPTGAVIVQQPGRTLGRSDVERVLNVPVVAQIEDEPGVARAVDAGLLATRLPRSLEVGLRPTVESLRVDSIATPNHAATQPPEASL